MITDSFDDRSPAKINVKKNGNAVRVDAVIYTFSQEIEKYVVSAYDCEKAGEYLMACGPTSVYLLRHRGKTFGFFRTWVGAPPPASRRSKNCRLYWMPIRSFISAGQDA